LFVNLTQTQFTLLLIKHCSLAVRQHLVRRSRLALNVVPSLTASTINCNTFKSPFHGSDLPTSSFKWQCEKFPS